MTRRPARSRKLRHPGRSRGRARNQGPSRGLAPGTRAVALLSLVLVALGLGVGSAAAHATLVSMSPAVGSSPGTAPTKVVLRFDEPVRSPSTVVVTGPGGDRVDRGEPTILDADLTEPVSVHAAGTYTVAYRVVSADGHPVTGEERFTFAGDGTAASDGSRPAAAPAASTGGGHTGPVVAGGVAVLVVVGAALLLVGRRRQPEREQA